MAKLSISRMPAKVQDAVSRALEDGATWRGVAELCAAAGFPGVTAQNVTNYRRRAHKDWLARQERLEEHRAAYAWKLDLLNKYKEQGGPAEAGLAAAMDMLESVLGGVDVADIKAMIADNPDKILVLIRTLRELRRDLADIRREERESAADEADRAAQQAATAKKDRAAGLTADDLARIENAMNLL